MVQGLLSAVHKNSTGQETPCFYKIISLMIMFTQASKSNSVQLPNTLASHNAGLSHIPKPQRSLTSHLQLFSHYAQSYPSCAETVSFIWQHYNQSSRNAIYIYCLHQCSWALCFVCCSYSIEKYPHKKNNDPRLLYSVLLDELLQAQHSVLSNRIRVAHVHNIGIATTPLPPTPSDIAPYMLTAVPAT